MGQGTLPLARGALVLEAAIARPLGKRIHTLWAPHGFMTTNVSAASVGPPVAYFAKKHGTTQAQTRALIKKHRNSRKTLDAAA